MFKYTLDNKRYHTFNYFLRNKFNSKVFKIPLDAGASCPNKQTGGCIYCKDNSKANITDNTLDLEKQYLTEVEVLNKKWPKAKHIVYFQTGSNTSLDLNLLKKYCDSFLKYPEVVGISIATRPDCISDECYKYFKLELPSNDENSELVADDASVIDETSADVKNSERVYEEVVADEEAV